MWQCGAVCILYRMCTDKCDHYSPHLSCRHIKLCHGHGEDMIYTRLLLGLGLVSGHWSALDTLITDIQGSRATSFV